MRCVGRSAGRPPSHRREGEATFERHFETAVLVPAPAPVLFAHLDAHGRLAAHMSSNSLIMGGSRLHIETNRGAGQAVGSKIRLAGCVLGLRIVAEETVTQRDVPWRKAWETVGPVRLLVVGSDRMGFDIHAEGGRDRLRVWIDYELPRGFLRVLAFALGPWYARWCTRRMAEDARAACSRLEPAHVTTASPPAAAR